MAHGGSPIPDFKGFLRFVVGLDEDDIQLILKQNISNSVTFDLTPGIYSLKDTSDDVYIMGDHEGTLQSEYDHFNMKTELVLTGFGSNFEMLRFDEKSFIKTLSSFTPYWDYTPTSAIQSVS